MSNVEGKRYTVTTGSCIHYDIEDARECAKDYFNAHIYELGPEVTEPDYGPLVEWARGRHVTAPVPCQFYSPVPFCDCGLDAALKAAEKRA